MKTRKVLAATLALGTLLSSSAAMANLHHHTPNFEPEPHRFEQRENFHERREFTHRMPKPVHGGRGRREKRHRDFEPRGRTPMPIGHRMGMRW